ncbi:MAG: hypothetical protein GY769_04130, partial [bacterium]|nr:hypothetical protein [bacterium]
YNGFGSYELFHIKSLWDFHSYTNRLVWYFLDKKYKDAAFVRKELQNKDKTIALTKAVQDGFTALATHLTATGEYERKNQGEYSLRQNRFRMEEEMLVGYDDDVSINSHFNLCKLTVSELVECRFGIQGFLTSKLAQHKLSAAALSSFELSEDWLDSICDKVAKDVQRQLETRFGANGFQVAVDGGSFSQPLPKGLDDAPAEVKDYAAGLWQERAVNPVVDALITGPPTRG